MPKKIIKNNNDSNENIIISNDTKPEETETVEEKVQVVDEVEDKVQVDEVEDKVPLVEVEVSDDDKSVKNNFNKTKKIVRKAGRTLLIKVLNEISTFDNDLTFNLDGLLNKTNFSNNKTMFLTFDSIDNSIKALKQLRLKSTNIFSVKFSYYKLFFTITGLNDNINDYNIYKKSLIDHISNNTNINVLYCKFYCKNNKYMGCGDLTVDTIDGMNKLLSKDNGLKEFKVDNFSGVFYRFNKKTEGV